MAVRIPGFDWWHEIEFMYDTGANLMNLWESDIETLLGPFHPGGAGMPIPELPVLGTLEVSTLLGTTIRAVLRIEVAILRADGKRMTPWTKIPFYLMEGDAPPGGVRCDGPIMRHLLFMTHTPDNSGKAIASTSKLAFNMTNSVPAEQRKIDYGRSSMRNDILVAPPGTNYKTVYNWYDLPNPANKRPMPEAARRVP